MIIFEYLIYQPRMETPQNQRKSKEYSSWLIGISIGLAVIFFIYSAFYYILYHKLNIEDQEVAGQFGDMFGAVNSLFSALAFLVISLSLYVQNRELKLQRLQLKQQMNEAKETRESNKEAQEAQRKEMQMTRELHAKNNFEAKLMFLLQNLERQINIASGAHIVPESKHGSIEYSGYSYFDHLHKELSALIRINTIGIVITQSQTDPYTQSVFNTYQLLENSEYWVSIGIEEPEEYNRTTIRLVHERRKAEYYNSWLTFRTIIKTLRDEYENWKTKSYGSLDELEHNFEIYSELLKSAMPFTARIYYLYLNLLDGDDNCNDIIYKKIYGLVENGDFFHSSHKEILFGKE